MRASVSRSGRGLTPFFADLYSGYQAKLAAGFAVLGVRTEGGFLTAIEYLPANAAPLAPQNATAEEVCSQLNTYLGDAKFRFDLPLKPAGTAFQREVWRVISGIPPGKTLTYLAAAKRVYSSARAVGRACGANPVPLVIPCHRVVGSHGLGGFMNSRGDVELAIKRWLLTHESRE